MARWQGILMLEGLETSDGRMIDVGATVWRELPLTLAAVFIDGMGGHENAIPVGRIDTIERRDGGEIYATGEFAEGDADANRAASLLEQRVLRGVSVDLAGGAVVEELLDADGNVVDIASLSEEDMDEIMWGERSTEYHWRSRWTEAELASATLVRTPAFAGAALEVVGEDLEDESDDSGKDEIDEIVAAAFATIDEVSVGDTVSWMDEEQGEQTGVIEEIDADAEEVTVEGGQVLPVADVTLVEDDDDDDEGGGEMPMSASAAARPALRALLARRRGDTEPITAAAAARPSAVVTAAVAWEGGPPSAYFERLELEGPTPFTITDDGEVFGHVALFDSCHTGFVAGGASDCVRPPRSPSNYALFHANRQIRTAEGDRFGVGVISMGTGHAPQGRPGNRPPASSVVSHYDNTGTQAAYVVARDDDFGVQVHGVLRDGLALDDVRTMMAAAPSGDWRDANGDGLDLLGLLMVNVPGFPTYRVEDDVTVELVASLSPTPASVAAASEGRAPSPEGCGGACSSCKCSQPASADDDVEPVQASALARSSRARLASYDRVMA